MANNNAQRIPCKLIIDLLPSYIDRVTSEETNAIIAEHLQTCLECQTVFEAMLQPDVEKAIAQKAPADVAKVRYMKKIKNRQRITILVIVAILLILAIVANYFISVRVYPFPVDNMRVSNVYRLENGGLYFEVQMDGELAAKLTALGRFSYQTEHVVNEEDAVLTNPPDMFQFEFQLGYTLIDLWTIKDNMKSGHFYFIVDAQLLENVDAVYFRGVGGSDRLLLWQYGDQVTVAPEDIEEKVATIGHTAFGSEFVLLE